MWTRFAMTSVPLVAICAPAQDKDPKLNAKERTASKLAAEATELMKQGEWTKGIRLCDRAMKPDPVNVNARGERSGVSRLMESLPRRGCIS